MNTVPPDFARFLNIRSATTPVVSPDGAQVAFLSDITGTFQVWSVTVADPSSWPRQLTFFADKVWELHGTAAADHLLAVGDVGGNERQQFYLIDGYGVDASGEEHHSVRRLTTEDAAIHRFGAFSRDGMHVAMTSNARNGTDFDVYVLDIAQGEQRLVAEMAGNCSVVAWSPDERQLLVQNAVATEEDALFLVDVVDGAQRQITTGKAMARYLVPAWRKTGIFTLSDREEDRFALCRLDPRDGELTTILTAEELLRSVGNLPEATRPEDAVTSASGTLDGELDLAAVNGDGQQAAVTLNVEGYSILYLVDLTDGGCRRVAALPSGVIGNVRFSPRGDGLVLDLQAPRRNPDIWFVALADLSVQRLTWSNRAGIAPQRLAEPDLIRFTAFDARPIPAFYYRPGLPQPARGYPCILYVHGGPASQQRPDFDVRFQYFLSQGYALLVPNVRGSTGYGRTFMGLDDLDRRMDSVADLRHAVLWLQTRAEIDHDRIAIYGRSYGGFMVLAAMTEYPDLFAAGIDVVGIADWVTFLQRTSAWRRQHREREYGSLAHDAELLRRISPLHRAANIRAPLMVVAGDNDPRVPLYESEQIVDRVRAAGGSVEFVHYADEGHRISKLDNRIDSFTRMAAFLARTLGTSG